MSATQKYGFDPICNECRKDINWDLTHKCPKCHTPYCSEECRSKETLCLLVTPVMILIALREFGFKREEDIPCQYRGCRYIPLPGPLQIGKAPPTLWPCTSGKPKELKEKVGGTDECYYFVALQDLYKLYDHQLTEEQKNEIQLMGDEAVANKMMKMCSKELEHQKSELDKIVNSLSNEAENKSDEATRKMTREGLERIKKRIPELTRKLVDYTTKLESSRKALEALRKEFIS